MVSYRRLAMRVLGHVPVLFGKKKASPPPRVAAQRIAALALACAMMTGMALPAFAGTYDIANGSIEIHAKEGSNFITQWLDENRTEYYSDSRGRFDGTYEDTDNNITINDSNSGSGTSTRNTVTINAEKGQTANVTLENVEINASSTGQAAVEVTGSGDTNIELNGNNTLTGGVAHAGLEHNKKTDANETSGKLTITDTDGDGSLCATGTRGGAGIGGGNLKDAGKIEITGGSITATGSQDGAGIGGGGAGGDADITISGGTINAIGVTDPWGRPGAIGGAGIGGGQGLLYYDDDTEEMIIDKKTVGNVTIEGNAKIENAKSGYGGSGIGGGAIGIGNVIIRGNAQIGNATGGEEGAGIGGGALGTGDVTIEGNVTIENAQGGAGAAGIGGGAETEPDTEDTRNKVSIKSTEAGSPNITATGGGVLNNEEAPLPGAAAIGSGSVADGATEVKSDITIEGKVTIDATGGGDVAIGDSTNGETQFSGLQVGTTITRRNAKGDDVSQPGDIVREQAPTETEAAEAPSTGSVEVERPVTVEGLYVTNVLGKQITHTCTQNGTTLTIRANGIVTSAHLTLGMVRTLKAQGVKTLVFTTLLSRSTTVSVDALLAAEPDAPDETAVVWTHTGPRAALTIGGADHSALLK